MDYIAHIRESDGCIQTVNEHLLGVCALAENFGEKLGVRHIAGLAGLLHDLGKYTEEFRTYILEAVNNPDAPPRRGSVDHSTAGGKLLFDWFHPSSPEYVNEKGSQTKAILAEIVGNAIISHHSYLQDFLNQDLESSYLKRVRDKNLEEFDSLTVKSFFEQVMDEREFRLYVDKAELELIAFIKKEPKVNLEHKSMLLSKFIFSTLVDADRTNTRCFEQNKKDEEIDSKALFEQYYDRLMSRIESFNTHKHAGSAINQLRREMSEQCDAFAERATGIYTLSIPTGGGKTLASLRYALKHTKRFSKQRIIYVVPYTTIIEQNAEEIRKILRDDQHLLEHHSNVVEAEKKDDEEDEGKASIQQKLKLAKDNWDAPIIFTTMVQFLNVYYADGSRNIRRLHNLSNAVIIFDEVQKVPIPCISLFNQAVNFLKTYANSSIVLCTATQPELDYVRHKLQLSPDAEMIHHLDDVIQAFKRVEIIDRATGEKFNTDKLADFVMDKTQEVTSVLVILNTRSVVRSLYNRLLEEELSTPVYHLSTSMCAAHRNEILTKVKKLLEAKQPVICISTQLIEAGVDVSFECAVRSLAGLDSIAQAAGRCNRHGEDELRQVYVIDHAEENLKNLKEIRIGKVETAKIFTDFLCHPESLGGHLLSVQAMKQYFQAFYTQLAPNLNYPIPKLQLEMTELLSSDRANNTYHQEYRGEQKVSLPLFLHNSYKTAAEHFHVIDSHTTSVIVPFGKGKEIIADLNGQHSIQDLSRLLREAQQYTINIFSFEKEALSKNNGIVCYLDGKVFALKEGTYSSEYGLDLKGESVMEVSLF
ncbi:CRISPR-associated helicase Cas3' [Paenibacillus tritici]|uniref:CRISPR-associated helicase Cas3' n=1 Tax=Paenibacillus tritici TaxID=1873425 RepID=UPI001BAB86C6|nr:CRISPR-associated helicase Cas3' [Paenibacillus tritici]QUL56059.1 CRISPR-associated helicase Cas3' [Paenibacillus tritici]